MIPRLLFSTICDSFFQGKVIILYGPRQVGKTTLCRHIMTQYPGSRYFTCDEPDVRDALTNKTSIQLKMFLGDAPLIILDEAQRVKNIGLSLKLLIDQFPALQIVATGSSSFELANEIVEPLTGRKVEFYLLGISVGEYVSYTSLLDMNRTLERRLIYGMYPDILLTEGPLIQDLLKELSSSYLYRDVLMMGSLKNPDLLEKLLQALALQLGNEVSYTELAQLLGVDKNTVSHYLQLLEKSFIIFRLPSLSRNVRNEIKKSKKYYFYDNGIRNAIINHFNPLSLRQDVGALWENFMISERMKSHYYRRFFCNRFFWRTHSQQEIDYIEEFSGTLSAYEFKWNPVRKGVQPKSFFTHYPGTSFSVISRENYSDFLI